MRFLTFIILLGAGLGLGFFLAPFEEASVRNHLVGFPNADARLHQLRPWAVVLLCLLPALGALWYTFASILDRYLFRKTLVAFLITTAGFLLLFILMDFQDSMSDLLAARNPAQFFPTYYAVLLSQTTVLLLPFTILLALLYSLGQLSASREIVAFTQTGRGIFRLLRPLVVLGGLLSLLSFCLNFHLAPWARGYREALLSSANQKEASQAANVIHHTREERRLWFIGGFPYDLSGKSPLTDVQISIRNEDGSLQARLKSPRVSWNRENGHWSFAEPTRLAVQSEPTPEYEENLPDPLVFRDWEETPSQLIQEGLDARYLGIPGLHDWLRTNPDRSTFLARSFESQLHYRWAQPWLCLVTVLLAAPLGISFSRRGRGGTVAVAIILSALMLFCAEVFLAFGDSGRIPPIPAAWATNSIFLAVALLLIQRRLKGRPIFQTIRRLCGN
ncbi:LptF/LptG family permease [Roseibacillus ishigakijimensis]|uniref:LptF/LptG family permease n=1 Tax=Roseibacillus ishigakijimensis TaxID=454146 RepID=A0A934RQN6_9BACT|nr:LptF/LptG family permease [Roseibacillus ishigakijimensis]MBK1833831.1 LptF/LptG family permease [Roseibacillus ishigakijimensis]